MLPPSSFALSATTDTIRCKDPSSCDVRAHLSSNSSWMSSCSACSDMCKAPEVRALCSIPIPTCGPKRSLTSAKGILTSVGHGAYGGTADKMR
eukprot:2591705-Amphidinium_carterae.1